MKLRVGTKISILVVALVVCSNAIVGWVVYRDINEALVRNEYGQLSQQARLRGADLAASIAPLREDLQILAGTPAIQGILRAHHSGGIDPIDGSSAATWSEQLATVFAEYLRNKPSYLQIRLIGADDGGRELIRVERVGGHIVRVDAEKLQQKAHRPYFQRTRALAPGHVHLSDIDLNREHHRVEVPHTPVLRAAVPLHTGDGGFFGIIIINKDFTAVLHDVIANTRAPYRAYVTNSEGDFLAHPNPEMTFGFDLGERHRIQESHDELRRLFDPASSTNEYRPPVAKPASGQVMHFVKVRFDPENPRRFLGTGISIAYSDLMAEPSRIYRHGIASTAVLTLIALLLSQILIRPLKRITKTAEAIAQEEPSRPLPTSSRDEIGSLATSFQTMIEKIEHRTRALRKVERQLRTREARLQHLVDTSHDAVIFIDGERRIIEFNRAASRMFGYSAEEARGLPVEVLMPNPLASEHDRYIDRYEHTGAGRCISRVVTTAARRKDGGIFPIEISVTAFSPEDKVRYGAFVRDMSEKVRLQQQLIEHERRAATGVIVASFAHEVGNPLNALQMNTLLLERNLAKQGIPLGESATRGILAMKSELARLSRLLDDFRALSNRQQFHFEEVDLRAIITEVLTVQRPQYTAHDVEVEQELAAELPSLIGDCDKIKQLLLNLCKNATEAMPEGGTLTVRAHGDDESVIIEISDTGVGVPEEVNIFEPFTTTKPGGTGLGLAIVEQLVTAHGGKIEYTSEKNRGTTFRVQLSRSFLLHHIDATAVSSPTRGNPEPTGLLGNDGPAGV